VKAKAISFTPEVLKVKLRALEEYGRAQTRRPMKPQPAGIVYANRFPPRAEVVSGGCGAGWVDLLPQYNAGDVLWARERALVTRFLPFTDSGPKVTLRYEVDGADSGWVAYPPRLREPRVGHCIPNGVHREGARHFLEVVEVRAERVAEISEQDARLEGVEGPSEWVCTNFFALYDSIYGDGAHVRDWCWVYTLKRAEP
jgi:hypothetical protein